MAHHQDNGGLNIKQEENTDEQSAAGYDDFFATMNKQLSGQGVQVKGVAASDPRKYGPGLINTVQSPTDSIGLSPVLPTSTNGTHAVQQMQIAPSAYLNTPADTMTPMSEDVELPEGIIFASTADAGFMQKPTLAKMPNHVFQKMLETFPPSTQMGMRWLGDVPMDKYNMMIRLRDFVDHGDYAPFTGENPRTDIKVPNGYSPAIEYDDFKTKKTFKWTDNETNIIYSAPEATKRLLLLEIETYLYAIQLDYKELQAHSRRRIFAKYPKTATSVYELANRVFPEARRVGDGEMMAKIVAYVNANAKRLTVAPWYADLMTEFLKDASHPLGHSMLQAYIAAHNALLQERDKEKTAKNNVPPAPPTQVSEPAPIKLPIPEVKRESIAYQPTSEPENMRQFIPQLVDYLQNDAILTARYRVWGTKFTGEEVHRPERNKDFSMEKGEVVCLSREFDLSVVAGHQNIVVINSRGEYGDVLRASLGPLKTVYPIAFDAGSSYRPSSGNVNMLPVKRRASGD